MVEKIAQVPAPGETDPNQERYYGNVRFPSNQELLNTSTTGNQEGIAITPAQVFESNINNGFRRNLTGKGELNSLKPQIGDIYYGRGNSCDRDEWYIYTLKNGGYSWELMRNNPDLIKELEGLNEKVENVKNSFNDLVITQGAGTQVLENGVVQGKWDADKKVSYSSINLSGTNKDYIMNNNNAIYYFMGQQYNDAKIYNNNNDLLYTFGSLIEVFQTRNAIRVIGVKSGNVVYQYLTQTGGPSVNKFKIIFGEYYGKVIVLEV